MNAKFSFVLLVAIIALLATSCAPAITGGSGPIIDAAQSVSNKTVALIPATGASSAEVERLEAEPRLWSGEIFLSEADSPDVQMNVQTESQHDVQQTGCMSEDDQPRRHGGCVE